MRLTVADNSAALSSEMLNCVKYDAGLCASCTQIQVPYHEQILLKQQAAAQLLAEVAGQQGFEWLPPAKSELAGFRNKAKFVVGGRGGDLTLGLVRPDGEPVDLTDCPIQDPRINSAASILREFLNSTRLSPYSVTEKRGELKFVLVTVSPLGQLLVRFVVRSLRAVRKLAARASTLRETLPEAVTVTVNLLPEHKAVLEGEEELVLWGAELAMQLEDVTLYLLPQSFFQTNTEVAIALYQQAQNWAKQVGPRRVLDLYCGVGGFSLFLAPEAGEVQGVEISAAAVKAARKAARRQHSNARFVAADATKYALQLPPEKRPDLLVVNPPRRGIGTELADWIRESPEIEWVVYSSCNPRSLAADIARLKNFRIESARLFDMFAHTAHAEVAVLLYRQ